MPEKGIDPPADQRLPAGHPDLGNPHPDADPDDPQNLLVSENLVVGKPGDPAAGGDAIAAPEIAPVGDGDP